MVLHVAQSTLPPAPRRTHPEVRERGAREEGGRIHALDRVVRQVERPEGGEAAGGLEAVDGAEAVVAEVELLEGLRRCGGRWRRQWRDTRSLGRPSLSLSDLEVRDARADRDEAISLHVELLEERAALEALDDGDAVLAEPELSQLGAARQARDALDAVRPEVQHAQAGARVEARDRRQLVAAGRGGRFKDGWCGRTLRCTHHAR